MQVLASISHGDWLKLLDYFMKLRPQVFKGKIGGINVIL